MDYGSLLPFSGRFPNVGEALPEYYRPCFKASSSAAWRAA